MVPVELHGTKKKNSKDTLGELAFNNGTSPTELPSTMTRHKKAVCTLTDFTLKKLHRSEAVEISELKNDSVLALVINRAVHLKEVFSSIDSMRITRDFNIYKFPLANKRTLINVVGTEISSFEDGGKLESDMNNECLRRNLASFGLAVDPVPGNGDCCFTSIVKQIHKLVLGKDDETNIEFRHHLQNLGFKTSLTENTNLLRSLFC